MAVLPKRVNRKKLKQMLKFGILWASIFGFAGYMVGMGVILLAAVAVFAFFLGGLTAPQLTPLPPTQEHLALREKWLDATLEMDTIREFADKKIVPHTVGMYLTGDYNGPHGCGKRGVPLDERVGWERPWPDAPPPRDGPAARIIHVVDVSDVAPEKIGETIDNARKDMESETLQQKRERQCN